jgi:hypothetical protein
MFKFMALILVSFGCFFFIGCSDEVVIESHEGGGAAEYSVRDWNEWELLGQASVDSARRADHDTIEVGRREGRFSELAIRVEDSRIELYDMQVTFTDGESFSPRMSLFFDADTTSRIIYLPGARRTISHVEFWYRDLPGGGRATVQLYGR